MSDNERRKHRLYGTALAAVLLLATVVVVYMDYRAGAVSGTPQELLERFIYYGVFIGWGVPGSLAIIGLSLDMVRGTPA